MPKNNFGKIFLVLGCIFGIFLLSMIVAVITLYVVLDNDEEIAYEKLLYKDNVMDYCWGDLQSILTQLVNNNKYKNEDDEELQKVRHMDKWVMRVRLDYFVRKKKNLFGKSNNTISFIEEFSNNLNEQLDDVVIKTSLINDLETQFFDLSKEHEEVEKIAFESRTLINSITNLAMMLNVVGHGGLICDVKEIDGSKLLKYDKLVDTFKKIEGLKKKGLK